MSVPFLLTPAQMRRIRPQFPLSHGVPRVGDRRVISGIVFVIKGGLRWRDAPPGYGPHKTLYNRFVRWSRMVGLKALSISVEPSNSRLLRSLTSPLRAFT